MHLTLMWACKGVWKSPLLYFLICGLLWSTVLASTPDIETEQLNFWVNAAGGDDSNDGSYSSPFQSFEPLKHLALKIEEKAVLVEFWPGTYLIDKFLYLPSAIWHLSKCFNCTDFLQDGENTEVKFAAINRPSGATFETAPTAIAITNHTFSISHVTVVPSDQNAVSGNIVFKVQSLSIRNCTIAHFRLQSITQSVSVIESIKQNLLEIVDSRLYNNTLTVGAVGISSTMPLFGSGMPLLVHRSSFEDNLVSSSVLYGGLFHCSNNVQFIDSRFVNNVGISDDGNGLIFGCNGGNSALRVSDCDFVNNTLLPSTPPLNDTTRTYSILGVTSGAIIAFANYQPSEVFITRSTFSGNIATRGGALFFGRFDMLGVKNTRAPAESSIHISHCVFSQNRAISGVGAAILLDEASLMREARFFNSTFQRNTAPILAYNAEPGIQARLATVTDATVIEISGVPGNIYFDTITMLGEEYSSYFDPLGFIEIHRIGIYRSDHIQMRNIRSQWAIPSPGSGSYLALESVHYFHLDGWEVEQFDFVVGKEESASKFEREENTSLRDLTTHQWDKRAQDRDRGVKSPNLNAWVLFHAKTDPDFSDTSQLVIFSNLGIKDWHYQSEVIFVLSEDIVKLELNNFHWRSIDAVQMTPGILIRSGTTFEMNDCSFSDVVPAIEVHGVNSVSISDVTVQGHTGILAAISFEACLSTLISGLISIENQTPTIAGQGVDTVSIFDSTFFKNQINTVGGVVYVTLSHSVEIERCNFTDNSGISGSALFVDGQLVVRNSLFSENRAIDAGGAIFNPSAELSLLRSSVFQLNFATNGGGVIKSNGPVRAISCNFTTNSVLASQGGAVYATSIGLGSAFRGCNFAGNTATRGGAAVSITGGTSQLSIVDCTFTNNINNRGRASYGGAVWTQCDTLISRSVFKRHYAYNGGAVAFAIVDPLSGAVLAITDSIFEDNLASFGGALHVTSSDQSRVDNWPVKLSNNTFTNNVASVYGGAIATIYYQPVFTPSIKESGNSFIGNTGNLGGGVIFASVAKKPIVAKRQKFEGNRAPKGGGSIVFYSSISNLDTKENSENDLCGHSICKDNEANWGGSMATYSQDLQSQFIDPMEAPYPDISPDGTTLFHFYSGIPRTLYSTGTDQFGNIPNPASIQLNYEANFTCTSSPSLCNTITHEFVSEKSSSTKGSSSVPTDTLVLLTITFQRRPGYHSTFSETIYGTLNLKAISPLTSSDNEVQFKIAIAPCGPGFGPSSVSSNICEMCPFNYYSLNGTCATCAYDSRVKSCFGSKIIAPASFWVSTNPKHNAYASYRCTESYCAGENECTHFREGPLCGRCIPGKHESLSSLCSDCNKANPLMIILLLSVTWIASIILHTLVVVSSGKSTILIFFVQTAWAIRSQIPFSTISGAIISPGFQKFVEYVTCIFPMDYLQRTVLIASVPFIMMLQLCLTFSVFYLVILIRTAWRKMMNKNYVELDSVEESHEPAMSIGYELSDEELDSGDFSEMKSDDAKIRERFSVGLSGSTSDLLKYENMNSHIISLGVDAQIQWKTQNRFFHPYRLIRTLLSLFASSYSSVLGIVMSTVGCVTLLDGSSVLRTAAGISCTSKEYHLVRLLYAVFIPYLTLVFLTLSVKLVHGYVKNTLSRTDVRFGVWYEMYKPKLFGWKLTEMLRRMAISVASNILISNPSLRASILCILMIAFLTIHLIAQPFRQHLENILETLSLFGLSVCAALVLWYTRQTSKLEAPATATTVVSISVAVIIVLGFVTKSVPNLKSLWLKLTKRCSK